MGKFKAFFLRKLGFKEDPRYATLLALLSKNPAWTKTDIANLTKVGYMNCTTVFACVSMITEAAASVPWALFRRPSTSSGKKELLEQHDILNLLRRPNPQEGGASFTKNTLAFFLITGNSYITGVGPEVGPPTELYTLRPDRTQVMPGNSANPIRGYRYTVNGVPRKPDFSSEEVLHLKTFHPLDDWYGLSPIEAAAKEIDIVTIGREWNMKLLQNDAQPPGALSAEGTLSEEQRIAMKKELKESIQGHKNVGVPLVLEGGLKWQPFAFSPRDMSWLQSDKMTTRKICSVFKVAPELIGDAAQKTYANYQEARKALYMEAVIPLLVYYRDELNNWLVPLWGDDNLYLDFDKNSIEAIREELSAIYTRQKEAYWRTIDQKRVACGDAEIGEAAGGNLILIPSGFTPLSDIKKGKAESE